MERLTDGLWYDRRAPSASLVGVRRRTTDPVEPVLRLRRGAMNGRRLHVDLVLLGGDRTVEVSFHPAATVDLVRGHARRRGFDANGWIGRLLGAVVDDAARWGSWTPSAPDLVASPLAVLGGVTHPLLGRAYDAGVDPAPQVPRWASPALAEPSMAAAAVRLFGAANATRPVVRALGALLLRPTTPWWHLGVAVALAPRVTPDDVATALHLEAAPDLPTVAPLPTAEDLAVLRTGLALLDPQRARQLVTDAILRCGVGRLTSVLRTLAEVKDDVRWPPPARLDELEALCLRATAIDPAPPTPPLPRPGPAVAAPPPPRPARPTWSTPRRAPETSGRPHAPGEAFVHPPAVRALDHDALVDELELVLPRTPEELRTWGRLLGSCLGDFGAAVAEHRSVIVGVRHRHALVAALELRPNLREVVQFLGPGNRVPPANVTAPVLARLAALA